MTVPAAPSSGTSRRDGVAAARARGGWAGRGSGPSAPEGVLPAVDDRLSGLGWLEALGAAQLLEQTAILRGHTVRHPDHDADEQVAPTAATQARQPAPPNAQHRA